MVNSVSTRLFILNVGLRSGCLGLSPGTTSLLWQSLVAASGFYFNTLIILTKVIN